jgi:phage host-nuclease inhibitor protein Gam
MAARRFRRLWLAATLAVAAPAFAPPAAADDAARQKVADQQAEAQVREGIKNADSFAKLSAADGVRALKAVQVALDLNGGVSAETRLKLAKDIQDRIAVLEGKPLSTTADPRLAKLKESQRLALEAALAEVKTVREGVAEVAKLYESGKTTDARIKLAALAQKYPSNPAVQVLNGQGAMTDRLTESKALAREQQERFIQIQNDISRSALPATKDMALAPDWKQRQELRKRLEPRLGPDEERILQSLEKPAGPPVNNMPLEETLQSLSTLCGQPLWIDAPSLEAGGADARRPVSYPPGVSVRTALRAILQSQGLTFVIKDKAIVVLTLDKARESLVTRSYYLGDAVASGFGGALGLGPVVDAEQTVRNAQFVIDAIKKGVDPMVWSDKNGPATVQFHYPSLSLIVRAPAEVQAALSSKLK